jgi:predicted Zn-dependent protease
MAASPQNDAAVQLTLSRQPDAVTAARAFLAQQGVQAGRTFQEPVNGIPAAGSYFQAQTQQGVVQGLVAFFAYGGRTYQLLAYAPDGRFEQYDALLRQSLGSFRPLTDPRLLAVQPNRIDVVRLAQPMTLAEFMRRYPSAAPPAEVALINQVDGPGAALPTGSLLKRVVPGGARS